MTAYAATVALKDPDGVEDIPLSRYRPGDPGTLTVSIINDDGTAFDVSIKDGLATTTGPREPTVGE